ncbi:MAG TPA: 50S ribosomal protein L10 [Candidatus Faecaligallichristensenella faecipullorum]|nr:50S ribosomal protein L10 [Candidatus Faecaligallichristensenella faecipullorum]
MSKNNLAFKTSVVEGVKEKMQAAQSMVLIDYRGLTVAEVTDLRNRCRKEGVEYAVIKNTMIRKAAEELGIEGLDPMLHGPTAVAFGMTDAVAPAKILVNFIKDVKKTEIKCGVMEGKVLDVKGVEALAELPPKEVLIAKMMGSLNAPITNFVGVLSATLRSLVYAIEAVRKQKAGE